MIAWLLEITVLVSIDIIYILKVLYLRESNSLCQLMFKIQLDIADLDSNEETKAD